MRVDSEPEIRNLTDTHTKPVRIVYQRVYVLTMCGNTMTSDDKAFLKQTRDTFLPEAYYIFD